MKTSDYWSSKHLKYLKKGYDFHNPSIFILDNLSYFSKDKRVLDLGCGTGRDAVFLAKRGLDVDAVDLNTEAAQSEVYKSGAALNLISADMSNPIHLEKGKYDVIYSILGIHYFGNKRTKEILNEIHSALKPGGYFMCLLNSKADAEYDESQESQDGLISIHGINKQFFTALEFQDLVSGKFKTILSDNNGATDKDSNNLVRFIGQK